MTGKSSKALPILAGTKLTINNTVYSSGSIDMKNQTASVSKTVTDQTVAAGQDASYTITTKVPNYVGYKVKATSSPCPISSRTTRHCPTRPTP